MYYKVCNTYYKVCNMYYKVCNKKYLIRQGKLSYQRVKNICAESKKYLRGSICFLGDNELYSK